MTSAKTTALHRRSSSKSKRFAKGILPLRLSRMNQKRGFGRIKFDHIEIFMGQRAVGHRVRIDFVTNRAQTGFVEKVV